MKQELLTSTGGIEIERGTMYAMYHFFGMLMIGGLLVLMTLSHLILLET
jgi:hypothetical protein